MNDLIQKDIVIIDRIEYDELIKNSTKSASKISDLITKCNKFEDYFLNDILNKYEYDLTNIEDFDLADYYVREIANEFFKIGINNIDYILSSIERLVKYNKINESEGNNENI